MSIFRVVVSGLSRETLGRFPVALYPETAPVSIESALVSLVRARFPVLCSCWTASLAMHAPTRRFFEAILVTVAGVAARLKHNLIKNLM